MNFAELEIVLHIARAPCEANIVQPCPSSFMLIYLFALSPNTGNITQSIVAIWGPRCCQVYLQSPIGTEGGGA